MYGNSYFVSMIPSFGKDVFDYMSHGLKDGYIFSGEDVRE